jgi:hypothetical protein
LASATNNESKLPYAKKTWKGAARAGAGILIEEATAAAEVREGPRVVII